MSNILLLMIYLGLTWTPTSSKEPTATFDVNNFIYNYVKEVQKTLRLESNEHTIMKRSLDVDLYQLQGLELLVGYREMPSVPASFPSDIVFFCHCGEERQDEKRWFAVALEVDIASASSHQKLLANRLILYKQQNGLWMESDRKAVFEGVRLATEQIDDLNYIIVAEQHTQDSSGSSVFQVNTATNTLEFCHQLPVHYPSHVIMWKWEDVDSFAAVAISENPPGSAKRYNTKSPVFQWQGSHFDEIDTLATYNPQALAQFNVGSSKFIAVANFQNDLGDVSVDSEIFRYSVSQNQQKFTLHQKLPTQAAIDVKYFCFQSLQMTLQTESFLVFASAYHKDDVGNLDYNAPSIVYKMSHEEYFVPFQALKVKGVRSWLPVRYGKENEETLILVAASEEGITSFQYDGWRFVLTGAQAGRAETAFGPGPKSLTVFYQGKQAFISSANKHCRGSDVNIFSLETRLSRRVEDEQETLLFWQQMMKDKISDAETRVAHLTEMARTALSVNDQVLNLGSNVIFHNAEIELIETIGDNVREGESDSQLDQQLRSLNEELYMLENQLRHEIQPVIDEISFHTMTVHEVSIEKKDNKGAASRQVTKLTLPSVAEHRTALSPEIPHSGEFSPLSCYWLDHTVILTLPLLKKWKPSTKNKKMSLPSVEIECFRCHVHQNLEVKQMNGENMAEFLSNVVHTKQSVIFDEEVEFKEIALRTPLQTTMINGHKAENLIDWSREVTLDHGIEVAGNVTLLGDMQVGGTIDRVTVSAGAERLVDEEQAITSKVKDFNTLTASELFLSDNMLSGQNFDDFNQFTLKTKGDQIITEFMDFEMIAIDELDSKNLLIHNPLISSHEQPTSCEGESCEEEEDIPTLLQDLEAEASGAIRYVEFIDWPEEKIFQDLNISGTVIIKDGTLILDNLIDTKYNVSSRKLLDFGISLNTSVIDKPVTFRTGFETPNLSVDTLNGLAVDDLVDVKSSVPVILKGRKVFKGDLTLNGTTELRGNVNGTSVAQLQEHFNVQAETKLESLTVYRLNCSNVEIDGVDLEKLVTRRKDGEVFLKNLMVEEDAMVKSLMLRGNINNRNLEKMLNETVLKNGNVYHITGTKNFVSGIEVNNLTLKKLNDINTTKFFNPLSPDFNWKKKLSQAELVRVQNITYTGYLDEIEARDFGMWLQTEGDQEIHGSQVIDHVEAGDLVVNKFNYVDLGRIAREGIFLTDNVTLSHVVFEEVESSNVNVGGKMNGLQLPSDIALADSANQLITAEKHLLGSLVAHGHLHLESHLSGVNLNAYCQAISANSSKLNIQGNAKFKKEPTIYDTINNNKWTDLMHKVWFVDDNVNITRLMIQSTQFSDLSVDIINGDGLNETLTTLISLSQDQVLNGTFYFKNIKASKNVVAQDILVGGTVQGIELKPFVKSVLLDGEDQEILGIIDFTNLIVDGGLVNKGLVNGLNLSIDVMRTDVPNNTMTSALTIQHLSAGTLTLPAGTLLAGVDLHKWDRTAVKTHQTSSVLTGNLVFTGEVDMIGIRVDGLVNELPFDEDHLMLLNGSQKVTGIKTFSDNSKLRVGKLEVAGLFNDINITEFYNNQVTTEGNVTLTGHNSFTSPLYTNRVQLPQIYQTHNLTRLEALLSSPLPWKQYHQQMKLIEHTRKLAEISVKGKAYYLKNFTRVGDIKGKVLYTLPLRTDSVSVVAAITDQRNKIKLSLHDWDSVHNMFRDMRGYTRYSFKFPLEGAQSVTMPNGEMAVYATSYLYNASKKVGKGEIFTVRGRGIDATRVKLGKPGTSLLYFQDSFARTCYVMVKTRCRVVCLTNEGREKLNSFSCQNVTQAALVTAEGTVFMVGLQMSNTSSTLLVWKLSGRSFTLVWAEPQFNPVSIAATMSPRPLFAVANRHQEGSSRPETIDIYRLNVESTELVIEQSLPSISPKKVLFATLPTIESVMYVASDNPATPLEVFVYRGLLGYQSFMVEATLPTPLDIHAFTDHRQQHFVFINSRTKGCVLQAQFQGEFVEP